jgi:hypothetical protein
VTATLKVITSSSWLNLRNLEVGPGTRKRERERALLGMIHNWGSRAEDGDDGGDGGDGGEDRRNVYKQVTEVLGATSVD